MDQGSPEVELVKPSFLYEKMQWRALLNIPGVLVALVLLGVVFAFGFTLPGAVLNKSLPNILNFRWPVYAVMLPCVVLLVANGGMDLSIGPLIGISATMVAALSPGMGLPTAVILSLAVGFLVGLFNGLLSGASRINGALITLGVGGLLRGAGLLLFGATGKVFKDSGFISSPVFIWGCFALSLVLGLGLMVVYARRTAVEKETAWARMLYTGLPYLFCSLAAALAGIIIAGHVQYASPAMGSSYEVDLFLIAVLGGTPLANFKISAGLVNWLGALLASLAWSVLGTSLLLASSDNGSFYSEIFRGAALVLGILVNFVYYLLVARIKLPAAKP